ncbi:ribonuclease H-like domain-containing protein [Tanacetum coccineum]
MDNIRPRTSSFSPSSRSSTTRTSHRPQRPKKIIKSIWVKKGITLEFFSKQNYHINVRVKGAAMINPKQTWRPKGNYLDSVNRDTISTRHSNNLRDKDKLSDFKEFKGGYVAFGNDSKGGRISGKGTIKTSCIDFEKVSYVEELKFNLLSVSQICDKKHNVLFTDKECLILSPKFKFVDEDLVILRAPRKNDVYSLDLKNIIPSGGVTCLVAKATKDEAVLWHRRLGHVNFKNINKLVKGNLVRGLPSKTFKLDHSCLACRKGKQHKLLARRFEERTKKAICWDTSTTNHKGYRVYNQDTRKVQDCLHVNFLEIRRKKGKGPDWMFDLDLLTPSMNYIPVRKENYAASEGNVSTHDDVEDLDDQQFIVHGLNIHAAQPMHSEESTADNEVPLSSDEQALHDELVSLMHQESLAKLHNDAQRTAFEKEKKRIALEKGKECVDSTFTLSTANTPPQSTGNTPTDSDDDIPKDGVFSTNSFDAEEGGAADYINMDPTIDVTSTPTLRIHKIHPQSQIIGKSTAGVQTRRKLKDSTSNQHQALLSFIYKQNRTNHKDQQTCLFACFLSQEEPKKVSQALADESWVEAMQEELLQFKLQEVWVLCDLPDGKRVIGQFARIEAIILFLAFAIFHGPLLSYQWCQKCIFMANNTRRGISQNSLQVFEILLIPTRYTGVSRHLWPHQPQEHEEISCCNVYVDDTILDLLILSMLKDFEDLTAKGIQYDSHGQFLNKFDLEAIKTSILLIEAHKSLGKDRRRYYTQSLQSFSSTKQSKGSLSYAGDNRVIEDQLQEDVNILAKTSFLGNARNKQLWLISLYKA